MRENAAMRCGTAVCFTCAKPRAVYQDKLGIKRQHGHPHVVAASSSSLWWYRCRVRNRMRLTVAMSFVWLLLGMTVFSLTEGW